MIFKYFYTLQYLKLVQLVFHVARRFNLKKFLLKPLDTKYFDGLRQFYPLVIARSRFNDLNLQYSFNDVLDGSVEQKLYLYNAFYMNDYSDEQYVLLHSQCYQTKSIFLEPYPTSLRIVNVLYYSSLTNKKVINYLKDDLETLSLNIEYELDGNHLLENYLALSLYELVIGKEGQFTKQFARLLRTQFVDCEWHFEQSPMYQAILLERIQCYLAIAASINVKDSSIIRLCVEILTKGVAYLQLFYLRGTMLHFNDSTGGNSLSVEDLINNNKLLGLNSLEQTNASELIKNGFARIESSKYQLVVDTSKILADHIPGHIHSATGTFWLFRDGKPFVINNAISTYQENGTRTLERGSSFHNCIVPEIEFNEVWGVLGLREGLIRKIHGGENWIALNAKLLSGQTYSRRFCLGEYLTITDRLDDSEEKITAFIYFDASVSPSRIVKHVHSTNIYCIDLVDIPVEFNKSVTSHFIYYKFSGSNMVCIQ